MYKEIKARTRKLKPLNSNELNTCALEALQT